MKKEVLSEQIGKIDEDIVEEANKVRQANAEVKPKRKKPIFIATSVFVAAAAAITGVVVIPKVIESNNIPVSETTTTAVTSAPSSTGSGVAALDGEDDPRAGFTRERSRSDIVSDITAVSPSGENIAADSGFSIKLSKDVSADELKSRLRISPKSEFTLTRENDSSYMLKTSTNFAKGSLVKLAVEDENGDICDSWAFRTVDNFSVSSIYPSDGSSYVPTDAGIEITFTEAPSDSDPSKYFEITPSVKGKFSTAENKLYFVPDDGLMPAMTYTVVLKKGFRSADGDALESGTSFTFRTSQYSETGNYLFTSGSMSGYSESFLTGDPVCIEMHCSEELLNIPFETHLYSFTDANAYYDALKAKSEERFELSSLPDGTVKEVFKSSEVPYSREGDRSIYVLLPDDLEKGCYVAEISAGTEGEPGYTLDYFIQVSDISVYKLSLGEENVFYVNDAAAGLPAEGAKITLTADGKDYTGTVDKDGLAYIKTSENTVKAMLDITSGNKRFTDSVILSGAKNLTYEDMYYTYLFTDREAYLPDDTINVWGVIIPKVRGTALPNDLKLVFGSEEKSVTPAADGTFSAKFTFTKHLETWYESIALRNGEDTLFSHGVSIQDYVKPTYILDLETPDYTIMPQTNPIPVTATVTYYEGTPAEGVMLENQTYYGGDDTKVLRTDSSGEVSTTVKSDDEEYWPVNSAYVAFKITGVEDSYTYAYKQVPALYRDTMLNYEYDDDSRTLTLHTYAFDLDNKDKLDKFFAEYENGTTDYDIIKKGTADTAISVKITRIWNEKTETGSHYDYIEKKTVKDYRYEYKNEVVYNKTVNTVNGAAVLADLPTDPELGWYNVEMRYTDSLGQSVREDIYSLGLSYHNTYMIVNDDFNGSLAFDAASGNIGFSLDAKTKNSDSYDSGYYNSFSENEDIKFILKCSRDDMALNGKLLIAVYQSDFVSYKIYDANGTREFLYKATADCIPDVRYSGAYFDGKHIYNVYGGTVRYDPTEREIDLDVKADHETYDAGDTAEITVTATDKSGNKLSGATVLLSLVDEAAFAIEDQNADPLGSLYRFIYYPQASYYVSYIQHKGYADSATEKGGGDPGYVRKDFKDTAYFMSATTDANGIAKFTAKLPDNMTTWRATVLAVYQKDGGEVLSGDTRVPVVVTRPLFISPIMHNSFVEGDDVALSAKCAGLPADGTISITLGGNGVNKTVSIKQQETAFFGKLTKGEYTVTFKAEYNGESDAVELPITVTDTLLETSIYKGADLTELTSAVKPTKWPTYLALFNKEYMLSTDILYDLLRYSGKSLDSRIASSFAAKELGYITEDEFISEYSNETADGLAKLLPADEGNVYLTALIAMTDPEAVSPATKSTLYNYINDAHLQDVCPAYMGLAALGEPVQNDVKKLLAEKPITYVPSGIYLSAALALCGDYNAAYDAYIKFVPEIKINDSDPKAVFAYVPNENGEPNQERTKTALLTASLLDLPEAEYFARYLLNSKPEYSSFALELATYIKNFVPKSKGEASFSYTLNGKTETVTLDRHHPTLMQLTEEQFNNANFTTQTGEIYVLADYIGRVNENDKTPTMTVTKTLSGSQTVGEEITVKIKAEPYCAVYDVVPSCGRISGSQSGQLIRLFTDKYGYATYKFTVNTTGEYVVECPVAYDYMNNTWGIGKRDTIKIGSGNEAV